MKNFKSKSVLKAEDKKSKKSVKVSEVFSENLNKAKRELQIRTYWRGNSYKKILHITIFLITLSFAIYGIGSKLSEVSASRVGFSSEAGIGANVDLLQQGIGVQLSPERVDSSFKIISYKVAEGDTLDSIATKLNVSTETIQWANSSKIDYFDKKVKVGDDLVIPEISGVLYEVQSGDTLDSVINKTAGSKFEVVELNQLSGPNYELSVGSRILIPNGKLPAPAPRIPVFQYYSPSNVGVNIASAESLAKLKDVSFVNPLSNPDCAGYSLNQIFWAGHDGVDLGRGSTCPIRAAAAGTVMFAGNAGYPSGYTVRIDHGNGVNTIYYHGAPVIWVKPGDQVYAGQEIMAMGSSGRVFILAGTALLHLSLRVDGVMVDPAAYIPY